MRQGTIGLKTRSTEQLEVALAVDKAASSLQESPVLFSKRESSEPTMYIHMFAFRYKTGVTDEQKKHVLDEIRKLLTDRERLYSRAGAVIDTSGKSVRQSLAELKRVLA